MNLEFRTIDLRNAKMVAAAVLFRRDSWMVSTGDEADWIRVSGFDGSLYIDVLMERIGHADFLIEQCFLDGKVIGQIEAGIKRVNNVSHGKINLFYLIEEYRGQGYGKALEDRMIEFFKQHNIFDLYLSVAPRNQSALKFYHKQGWTVDAIQDKDGFITMSKTLVDEVVEL